MAPKFLPVLLPSFAEEDDYPVSVHPWSGAPNKVETPEAFRNVGQQPDSQSPAQVYNWLNFRYGRGVRLFFHNAMSQWASYHVGAPEVITVSLQEYLADRPTAAGSTLGICRVNYTEEAGAPLPVIMAAGIETSTEVYVSTSGARWFAVEKVADSYLQDIAGGIAGIQFAIRVGVRHIDKSVNLGETWTTTTNVAPVDGAFSTLLVSGTRVLAAITGTSDATGNRLFVSDNNGGTWSPVDIGANRTIIAWATNGAGTIAAYSQNSGFGGLDEILYSTNNGDTWTQGAEAGAAIQNASMAYSSEWAQFMCVSQEGSIWNSEDGAEWIVRSGLTFLPAGINALASVGPVFAMVTSPALTPSPASRHAPGVLYTIDMGSTWYFAPLGQIDPFAGGFRCIRALGGRFICGSPGYVALSGPLWEPDPDLVIA
jgi:hypothetical protein